MPVKNAALYLKECIDSIQSQHFAEWELIAVNDHSDDNSGDILDHYARQDQRIKKINNTGKGIIAALRLAYQNSSGQFITRMDADDQMPANKLALLHKTLLAHGRGNLITGKVKYFSQKPLGDGYQKYQDWLNALCDNQNHFQHIYKECVIPSPCWLVYREDLDLCGAFDPDRYPEDYDLCFRFYQFGLNVRSIDQTLHLWRDHPERTSRNDPKYADVHFFDLKLNYFLSLDFKPNRPLVLWGTGRKGKEIARKLKKRNVFFHWMTDNPKKIGHNIYDSLIISTADLPALTRPQVIIAIAAPQARQAIEQQLKEMNLESGNGYFFFC